jgi:Uma2 family endonuclease
MAATAIAPEQILTLADLLDRLGGIDPKRIRFRPLPGTATEDDVLAVERREDRLCELVDGVLVEKTMGFRESLLALALGELLRQFVNARNLGLVTGPDGMLRFFPGLIRIPDVAYISWANVPGGVVPHDPIPEMVPDLAIEVLSTSNTPGEMNRKLKEYFANGVRAAWLVDGSKRTVRVYDSATQYRQHAGEEMLTGGEVLPGFELKVSDLFAELDRKAQG